MAKGKFIVFEGPDGSGKTTQAKLLYDYLGKSKIPAAYISFPRYKDSAWGAMVRRYLDGDFGKLDSYLASLLYAGDRFSASGDIRNWLDGGKIVVCDRYVASNIGHQAGKFKKLSEQNNFIKWLENLEYRENKIPREDLVIFLNLPVGTSLKLMSPRQSLDIHESDKAHQVAAYKVYSRISKRKYWIKLNNMEKGKLLSAGNVHKKVLALLKMKKIII